MTFLTRSLGFTAAWIGFAVLVVLVTTVATGHTAQTSGRDYITFNRPVVVPNAVLPPGEYVFEALRPDLIRVSRRATREILYTGFTHEASRLDERRRDTRIVFGEVAAGEPLPIATWFPEGRATGHRFVYR